MVCKPAFAHIFNRAAITPYIFNRAAITPHGLAIPFALGLAAGNADYLHSLAPLSSVHWLLPCTALLMVLAAVALFAIFLYVAFRPSRWPWRQAVVTAGMVTAGWCTMTHEWQGAEQEREQLVAMDSDNHIALIVAPPVRQAKTFRTVVELDNGLRATVHIPRQLADVLHEGQTIIFSSRLHANLDSVHTNQYARYQLHNRIAANGYVTALRIVPMPDMGVVYRLKTDVLTRLHSLHLPDRTTALAKALTLADRSSIPTSTRTTFQRAGVAHLLALSGTHLSLLLFVLYSICGRSLMHARRNGLFIATMVWGYVILTGAPYTLMRAATMLTIYQAVLAMRRNTTHRDMIMLALLVLLVCSPHALFDVGFQLSFVCVYVIAAFCMQSDWKVPGLKAAVCCTIATAPLTAYYFGYIPLYGCLSGLVLIPLTLLIIALTFIVLLCPHPLIGELLVWSVDCQTTIAKWFSQLPFAVIEF